MSIASLTPDGHTQVFHNRVADTMRRVAVDTLSQTNCPDAVRVQAVQHVGMSPGVGECASYLSDQGYGPFSPDQSLYAGVQSYFGWNDGINADDDASWESA